MLSQWWAVVWGLVAMAVVLFARLVVGVAELPVLAVAIGPLATAAGARPVATGLVGAASIGAGAVIGADRGLWWSDDLGVRLAFVAAIGVLAVALAAERERRERALSQSRLEVELARRLDLALAAGDMGTWVYESDTGRTSWDRRLERMYGFDPGTFDGRFETWIDRVHPEDRALVVSASDRAIAEREPYQVAHRALLPDGSIRWLEARGEPTVRRNRVIGTAGVVTDVTERMTVATELERFRDESREARHERDALTATLQTGLLPVPRFDPGVWDVLTRYRPGERQMLIGGDFIDVVQSDGALHVLIGDVSGHSAEAAAVGSALRAVWRASVLSGASPLDAMRVLDRILVAETDDPECFATVCSAAIRDEEASFVIAGHPRPLLIGATGVRRINPDTAGPPVGLGKIGGEHILPLEAPWSLLFFTDGLIEGRAEPGSREQFGEERLAGWLDERIGTSASMAEADVDELLAAVEAANGGRLSDDVAVVVVRPGPRDEESGSAEG